VDGGNALRGRRTPNAVSRKGHRSHRCSATCTCAVFCWGRKRWAWSNDSAFKATATSVEHRDNPREPAVPQFRSDCRNAHELKKTFKTLIS
jgi:hypothetical protein